MNRTRLLKVAVLCVVSAVFNALGSYLHTKTGIPLYVDTIFNAAMCFAAGLVPAVITGLLLSPVLSVWVWVYIFLRGSSFEFDFLGNIWVICIAVEILIIWFSYKRMKEREAVFLKNPGLYTFIDLGTQLLVLAVLDCIAVSVTGGIIDYVISSLSLPRSFSPEDNFKLGLLRNNVPLLTTAILSRIPINIVDRFFVIFGGYGVSLLYRKWLDKSA